MKDKVLEELKEVGCSVCPDKDICEKESDQITECLSDSIGHAPDKIRGLDKPERGQALGFDSGSESGLS